jgi:hypothetical protein
MDVFNLKGSNFLPQLFAVYGFSGETATASCACVRILTHSLGERRDGCLALCSTERSDADNWRMFAGRHHRGNIETWKAQQLAFSRYVRNDQMHDACMHDVHGA